MKTYEPSSHDDNIGRDGASSAGGKLLNKLVYRIDFRVIAFDIGGFYRFHI